MEGNWCVSQVTDREILSEVFLGVFHLCPWVTSSIVSQVQFVANLQAPGIAASSRPSDRSLSQAHDTRWFGDNSISWLEDAYPLLSCFLLKHYHYFFFGAFTLRPFCIFCPSCQVISCKAEVFKARLGENTHWFQSLHPDISISNGTRIFSAKPPCQKCFLLPVFMMFSAQSHCNTKHGKTVFAFIMFIPMFDPTLHSPGSRNRWAVKDYTQIQPKVPQH